MAEETTVATAVPTPVIDMPHRVYDRKTDTRPYLSIANILELPSRARRIYNNLLELAQSIKENGMINAIVVKPHPEQPGKFLLVAGGRRKRAAMIAGWAEVPVCYFNELDALSAKIIELEENIQRDEITWAERCENMEQIHELKIQMYGKKTQGSSKDAKGWNMEKTAQSLNIPISTVQRHLDMARKLKERPELKVALANLPMAAAAKRLEQLEAAESSKRLADLGKLVYTQKFICGDAVTELYKVDSESIDLIVTDPPFGLNTLEEMEGKDRGDTQLYTSLMKPDDNLGMEGVMTLMKSIIPEMFRVLKPGSHFYMFHNSDLYSPLCDTMRHSGFELHKFPLIWDKGGTTNAFNGWNYMACYEPIIFGWKPPRTRQLTEGMRGIISDCKPVAKNARRHIFQKPLDLWAKLIKQSSRVGDFVLDPFAGSASALVAGIQCGRSVLGFEKNMEHWAIAQPEVVKAIQDFQRVQGK